MKSEKGYEVEEIAVLSVDLRIFCSSNG